MDNSTGACNSAWDYVEKFYARDGVAEACLELQERLGTDLVLFINALRVYDVHGLAMDARLLGELNFLTTDWRDNVVIPLREMRRRLKPGLPNLARALSESTRQAIIVAERDAEFSELCMLVQSTSLYGLQPSSFVDLDTFIEIALLSCSASAVIDLGDDGAVRRSVATLKSVVERAFSESDQPSS